MSDFDEIPRFYYYKKGNRWVKYLSDGSELDYGILEPVYLKYESNRSYSYPPPMSREFMVLRLRKLEGWVNELESNWKK